MKRQYLSNVDFSEHTLKVDISTNAKVYDLRNKNGSSVYRVTFIVSGGITAVTGDVGNWIFCTEFHPHSEYVCSRAYFDGKLRGSSVQKSHEWSEEKTIDLINDELEECESLEAKKWYKKCISIAKESTSEDDYVDKCFSDSYCDDFEDIIVGSVRLDQLEIVYDAFNKICELMGEHNE